MSRSQRAYVQDILDAMEKAERYTEGVRFDEFAADEEKQDAVEWNFAVMGEAAKKLSNELRRENDDLPWSDIARMRDRIVHGYFTQVVTYQKMCHSGPRSGGLASSPCGKSHSDYCQTEGDPASSAG